MKKTIKFLFVTLVAVSLLVACGGKGDDADKKDAGFKVAVVLDSGGVNDKSFNQSSWEGVLRFLEDNNLKSDTATYLTSKDDGSDYVSNLETAAESADLVIAVGYKFSDSLPKVAPKYPEKPFLFIDGGAEPENVINTSFADEEGSYYVGLIAGKRAAEDGSNRVGFIGGFPEDVILAFQAGYEQGVWEMNPDAVVAVEYAQSFTDTAVGGSLATKLYQGGANIIFHAAGDVGNGVISEAKQHEDKWVIGVDKDQYEVGMNKDGKSVVLTSMLKRVDTAAYTFLQEYLDKGTIESTEYVFNTANDGIGAEISPERNLSDDEIKLVEEYMAKVKDGSVKISRVPVIAPGKASAKK